MAHKIVWSDDATADLENIVRYIAADNSVAAENFGLLLVEKVESLKDLPRRGRVVPEYANEDIRELILPPYRIIYQLFENSRMIAVARIWHSARGTPDLPIK